VQAARDLLGTLVQTRLEWVCEQITSASGAFRETIRRTFARYTAASLCRPTLMRGGRLAFMEKLRPLVRQRDRDRILLAVAEGDYVVQAERT
jgi:hypothetical protein